MKISGHHYYHEEQYLRDNWFVLLAAPILLGVIFLQVYGMYQQLYLGKPWGDEPVSDNQLLLLSLATIIVIILIAILLFSSRLMIEVRGDGFFFRFPVLINRTRKINLTDIESFEVKKYHPLRDFGGWGIRFGLSGKAYNVKGNMGLCIVLKNGKKILFGTQNPDELRRAMQRVMDATNK